MTTSYWKRLLLTALLVSAAALPFVAVGAQEATPEPTTIIEDELQESSAEEGEVVPVEGEEGTVEGPADEAEGEETGTAAAQVSPLTPLGINTGFLLAQIVNFLFFVFLPATIFLWRPMMNMLDSRAAKIQKGLEDASAAANARRNAETEAERIVAGARAETSRVIEEARQRGEDVRRQVVAEANTEAERVRTEGRTRANEERDRQLSDLRGQVAAIALAVSERLIGATLDEQRQQALISDFFSKVPDEARAMSGQTVEVVSAMPLGPDEQNRVRQETGATDVTFSVDPNILGGLIIRSQDRVVDGSVRNGLTELGSRLR